MKISYIIPTYNSSATILKCLDSIYNVAIKECDFEVIIIDDCSIDNTVSIVHEYALSKRNMTLLCQNINKRQGAARNRGLSVAKGDYITFVDSDDVILSGIQDAINRAENTHVDLVYCSCLHEISRDKENLKEIDMPEGTIVNGVKFCEQYQHEGVFWYPWGILYKRSWLVSLNCPFVEGRQHEDRDWLAYVMCNANTITYSKTPMYRYVFNPKSTCHLPQYSTIFDHVASGIRHVNLSKQLAHICPNLSETLYVFGIDEICKSLRIKNLTKYPLKNNRYLYKEKNMSSLICDLKRIFTKQKLPIDVALVIYHPIIAIILVFITTPIAFFLRSIKHQ